MGTTVAITGPDGAVDRTIDTDPWGNIRGQVITDPTGQGSPQGFTGELRDASGLIYLRARMYDPKVGQFISPDPLVSSTEAPYRYASGNPLGRVDPSGLADKTPTSSVTALSRQNKGCMADSGYPGQGIDFVAVAEAAVLVGITIVASLAGGTGRAAPAASVTEGAGIKRVPSAKVEAATYADELRAMPGKSPTIAAAAVDRNTGAVYRGMSGERTVRPAQIEKLLPKPSREPHWPAANCAEVAACSSAVANGARLKDLDVAAVRVKSGNPQPPCLNCETWVPRH